MISDAPEVFRLHVTVIRAPGQHGDTYGPSSVAVFAEGEVTETLRGELTGTVKLRFGVCVGVYPVQFGRDYLVFGQKYGADIIRPIGDEQSVFLIDETQPGVATNELTGESVDLTTLECDLAQTDQQADPAC